MKLLIILSVVACGYAAKLDRGYLPPADAATAGGAPGSLTAPGSGPSGSPAGQSAFPNTDNQGINAQSPSGLGFQSKPGFESAAQYQSGPQASGPGFGQPGSVSSSFQGPQGPQDATAYSGQYQPERARASLDRNAEILRYDNQNDGNTFAYSFETSNGISAEESGVATNGVQAQGGYSYTGDDGQQYRVTYTADENGYQPQGEHLPTPHPIPEEILKSIEENARAAAAGTQEGAYNPDEDSGLASQQYNNGPSYQVSSQQSGPAYQSGQAQSSQYGSPSSTFPGSASNGPESYQYQDGTNQNRPIGSGFIPREQAIQDQGPSPSTPTGTTAGFAPGFGQQPAQGGQSVFTGVRPGQTQNLGQSGYSYNQPQEPSFGRTNQESRQYRPQTSQASATPLRPQSQESGYSRPQVFGSTSGPSSQGPSNQEFAPSQGSTPTYSAASKTGLSASQLPSFSRPAVQSYTPTGPSASPSTPQGSTFARPSNSDQGYVYGPGTGPTRTANGKSINGQDSASSGPTGPSQSIPQNVASGTGPRDLAQPIQSGFPGSSRATVTPVVSAAPNAQRPFGAPQYPSPSAQTSQSALPRPNGPTGSPAPAQFPFGGASQYQRNQPTDQSSQSAYSRPTVTPTGPSAQGPLGSGPQYQSNLSAFPRPDGSNVGPSSNNNAQGPFGAGPTSGPKSSMPLQSAPYQYNRPGSQGPQNQGPGQNQPGATGFGTPEGSRPGQTFGAPRQPPSFSSEEGYKY